MQAVMTGACTAIAKQEGHSGGMLRTINFEGSITPACYKRAATQHFLDAQRQYCISSRCQRTAQSLYCLMSEPAEDAATSNSP